jgi:23S rRNA pseudouridine2604 synthase
MSTPIRLAKRLIEIAACSRREAELYIAGGWVTVNGVVVEAPQFMVTEQVVTLHPDAVLAPVAVATLLIHQSDENGVNTPFEPNISNQFSDDFSNIRVLQQHFVKLTPTLPLERNASGLVVLTQDWNVTRKLHDDAATIEQEYVVEVAGDIAADGLALLNHGLKFNGKALPPCKVSWQSETRLRFALKGVVTGQIAHACQRVGLEVLSLRRLRIGRVAMGKIPSQQWRYLMPFERF